MTGLPRVRMHLLGLRSKTEQAMRVYPVRIVVNSPKYDAPECIEAVA